MFRVCKIALILAIGLSQISCGRIWGTVTFNQNGGGGSGGGTGNSAQFVQVNSATNGGGSNSAAI